MGKFSSSIPAVKTTEGLASLLLYSNITKEQLSDGSVVIKVDQDSP